MYIPPKSKTAHQLDSDLCLFFNPDCPLLSPSPIYYHYKHLPLSSFFRPHRWNKYFHIPVYDPYSKNTFQFQKCIQKQVGWVNIYIV